MNLHETGPLVFEAPPNLQGILLDFWLRPIPVYGGEFFGDVGLPGPDAGAGGRFLVLPPDHEGEVPEGYFVYRSGTDNIFIFLRAFYEDPDDLGPVVALMEQAKIYPLGLPEFDRKPMDFPNASGVEANMLPRPSFEAFEQLKWLVDEEGENLAGPDGMGLLANVGLIEGVPFAPDERTRGILDTAADVAYKMSRVIGMSDEVGGTSFLVWPDRRWTDPANNVSAPGPDKTLDLSWVNTDKGYTDIEKRAWFFTDYYSWSRGMVSQTPGRGAAYYVAFEDADGGILSGDEACTLTSPADVPAELFWSLTLYEAENSSGLATEARRFPSLGSRDAPEMNDDGTIDLYIGPDAPEGREANWLLTASGRGFFAILQLYGPDEAAVDYSWKLGDLEKIDG